MADLQLNLDPTAQGSQAYYDLVFGDTGDLALTQGATAIEQAIGQSLRSVTENWFLDLSYGLPYYDELFGQRGASLTASFESQLQNAILAVPGVLSLLSWSAAISPGTRTLVIEFSVQVTGGTVVYAAPVTISG